MSSACLLVADADPAARDALAWQLREHGYEVTAVSDGAGALAALEARGSDLVLVDLDLPDADGQRLLEQIKADDRWLDLPVVLLAARPTEEAAVRAFGLGAADFIRKPVRPRELLARVQAQLRSGAVQRANRAAVGRAQEALARAQQEAESRRTLVDILNEVTGNLPVQELYQVLVRRAARALNTSRCAIVVAGAGDPEGQLAAAIEEPTLAQHPVRLADFPELRAALDGGQPIRIEDTTTHPLYAEGRVPLGFTGPDPGVRSLLALPFSVDRGQYGVFLLRRVVAEPRFTQADLEFAQTLLSATVAVIQRAQVVEHAMADNARLEQLAQTDALTQLLNRRALTARIATEMVRAQRYEATLALLMIDLDHFKQVNDRYGHLVGDEVLRDLGAILREAVRTIDVAARYGGEEFVVLLPETDDAGAEAFAERLRVRVAEHRFARQARPEPLRLTASIGLTVYPAARVDSVEDLLARADAALYRAKADGRDRVRR